MGLFTKAKPQDPMAPTRQAAGASVAARLDANPKVQRIAIDGVQFYHHANFLDAATCRAHKARID
jgi:prolyl 4-hydroxylase